LLEGAALERFVRVVKFRIRAASPDDGETASRTAWSDEQLAPALTAAGIPLTARAEDVALEAFVTLVRHLPAS
jgi:hypothetical protein